MEIVDNVMTSAGNKYGHGDNLLQPEILIN